LNDKSNQPTPNWAGEETLESSKHMKKLLKLASIVAVFGLLSVSSAKAWNKLYQNGSGTTYQSDVVVSSEGGASIYGNLCSTNGYGYVTISGPDGSLSCAVFPGWEERFESNWSISAGTSYVDFSSTINDYGTVYMQVVIGSW
jgi:hypothetical protein